MIQRKPPHSLIDFLVRVQEKDIERSSTLNISHLNRTKEEWDNNKEDCTALELLSITKLKSSGKKTKSSLMDYIARATPTISPKFYSKPIDRDIDAKLEEGNN